MADEHRAISSGGRALVSHTRGHWFDPSIAQKGSLTGAFLFDDNIWRLYGRR